MEEKLESGSYSGKFTLHYVTPQEVPKVWPFVHDWIVQGTDASRGKALPEDVA